MFNHRYQSRQRIDFDGVDERAYTTTMPNQMSASTGSISFWVEYDAVLAATIGLASSAASAPYANSVTVRVRSHASYPDSTASYIEFQAIRNGGASSPADVAVAAGVTTKIVAGTRYFITVTQDGTGLKIYVNGVAQTLANYGWHRATTEWWNWVTFGGTKRFSFGNVWTNGSWSGNSFDGKLDEVALWNTALSGAQVTELYNSGVPSNLLSSSAAANLENWWKMGEGGESGSIATLYDVVGSSSMTTENMENGDIQNVSY